MIFVNHALKIKIASEKIYIIYVASLRLLCTGVPSTSLPSAHASLLHFCASLQALPDSGRSTWRGELCTSQ